MDPEPEKPWARERIEGYIQTLREPPEPLPIDNGLTAHLSEADQRLCTEGMVAIQAYLEEARRYLKSGLLSVGPLRWAMESLALLTEVIGRAQAARQAELDALWEAKWEAEAPMRAAWAAEQKWIGDWSHTTPEGQAWQARADAAPTLIAWHEVRDEACAVYAAWQQANPEEARRPVEEARLLEIEINLPQSSDDQPCDEEGIR